MSEGSDLSASPRASAQLAAIRRVPTALLLLAAVTASGCGLLLADARPGVLVGILCSVAALLPVGIAARTLSPRGPGGVTAADAVTLIRYAGAGIAAAAAVLMLVGELPPRSWTLVLAVALVLSTDAIDGWMARRRGTAGPIGGLIDVEADAALVLMLSVMAAVTVGPWVLLIGLMRYLYVAVSRVRPALRGPLPPSQVRRVIGLLQAVALLAALVPDLPLAVASDIVGTALLLLCFSFGRDILRLELRHRADADRGIR